ncbi:unnamed protein product [Discosporangium mesarthrocarpum]
MPGRGGSGPAAEGEGGGEGVFGGVHAMFAAAPYPTARAQRGRSGESATVASAASPDDLVGLASQMSMDDMGRSHHKDSGVAPRVPEAAGLSAPGPSSAPVGGVEGAMEDIGGEMNGTVVGEGHLQLASLADGVVNRDIQRALQMLHEVDGVLEQLALFWANSEVIFQVLLRKGDLVEKFVKFANKPRLLQRFQERMADYKQFWEGVQVLCNKYVCGQIKCGQYKNNEAGTAVHMEDYHNKNEGLNRTGTPEELGGRGGAMGGGFGSGSGPQL